MQSENTIKKIMKEIINYSDLCTTLYIADDQQLIKKTAEDKIKKFEYIINLIKFSQKEVAIEELKKALGEK